MNRAAVALRAAVAFLALAVAGTAHATDPDTDHPADAATVPGDADTEDPPHHVSLFAGTDLTSKGSYSGFIGATLAPTGTLEQTGPRIGFLTSGGVYRYNTTLTDAVTEQDAPVTVKGKYISGDVLFGYGLVGENWNTKLYVGLNVQDQFISPPDPGNPVVGVRAGVKVQGDAWVNPTRETMLFGIASYSTAFRTYYSNFKVGYDIFNGKEIFVGPEIGAQGNERYDQLRVGAHITGLKINNVSLGFSGGYMHESDVGAGIYGTIDLSYDF